VNYLAWNVLRKNPVLMGALALIALFVALAVFGPYLRGIDGETINVTAKNTLPSRQFWFGADAMGRDLFTNLWKGLRVSLIVALVCGVIQAVVGCAVGGIMGYLGGTADVLLMRVIEIISSVPGLLITMIFMMILGNGILPLLLAISVTSWCGTARQIRGQIMQLREMEYILAAEVMGANAWHMITRHFIPNTVGVLIVNLTSSIPQYIFLESGLSFIGLGLSSPNISLGTLIASGQAHMDFASHQLLFPCALLCLVVLAFYIFGDGLHNALDPRQRKGINV
jgi:oligopeptide transport system permease protein